mmetsp:Transcript_29946/g.95705  ORF Transcript_29946/g.95705 Transcript_29946/m.95705 type:complete len:240 (+) Transcript_29946:817-1536(+)
MSGGLPQMYRMKFSRQGMMPSKMSCTSCASGRTFLMRSSLRLYSFAFASAVASTPFIGILPLPSRPGVSRKLSSTKEPWCVRRSCCSSSKALLSRSASQMSKSFVEVESCVTWSRSFSCSIGVFGVSSPWCLPKMPKVLCSSTISQAAMKSSLSHSLIGAASSSRSATSVSMSSQVFFSRKILSALESWASSSFVALPASTSSVSKVSKYALRRKRRKARLTARCLCVTGSRSTSTTCS